MTREEYITKHLTKPAYDELDKKRELLKQLKEDYYSRKTASQTLSAGGGTQSATYIALQELLKRIRVLESEIAALEAELGLAPDRRWRRTYIRSIG